VSVLRKIKHAYKSASELKCKACGKVVPPVIFKGHVATCSELLREEQIEEGTYIYPSFNLRVEAVKVDSMEYFFRVQENGSHDFTIRRSDDEFVDFLNKMGDKFSHLRNRPEYLAAFEESMISLANLKKLVSVLGGDRAVANS